MEYIDELTEYGTTAYVKCLDDMVKLLIEKEVKATVLILAEVSASFGVASAPLAYTVQVELLDVGLLAGKDQEVES